ncbi:transmembrane protein, putative [Medicago truncatula]|uniref:Transmembrane protein, putative n=1 Tax=Medicago truncatula TaxID=3880 RepID=G7KNK6_MEDTR|nr:transmembrane protein, putative [Medicago truncatula]
MVKIEQCLEEWLKMTLRKSNTNSFLVKKVIKIWWTLNNFLRNDKRKSIAMNEMLWDRAVRKKVENICHAFFTEALCKNEQYVVMSLQLLLLLHLLISLKGIIPFSSL